MRHQIRPVLPDQNFLKREVGKQVLLLRQLKAPGSPAVPSDRLFGRAPPIFVAAFRPRVAHHSQTHVLFFKLAHEVACVVQQRVQVKGPAVLLMKHGLVLVAKLPALLAIPGKTVHPARVDVVPNLFRIALCHNLDHLGPLLPERQ